MAYVRKTHDEWELWADYGYGKEAILIEDSYEEAKEQLRCYRENEPNARHWIKKIRVKN
jgi:hypothetical protein